MHVSYLMISWTVEAGNLYIAFWVIELIFLKSKTLIDYDTKIL